MENRLRLFLLIPLLVLLSSGCALLHRNEVPDSEPSNATQS